MYKYIIMGVQGCGKGTQAKLLCDSYDFVHISIGDTFRWHIKNHTKLAANVHRLMSQGKMVGDDLVEQVVSERLNWHDWNYGFILDGFPRTLNQAEFMLESYNINAVINLEAEDEMVMERILARRVCSNCGVDYNLIGHRPKVDGICDVCHGRLVTRDDDHEEAIRKRLNDYHAKTEPMVGLFSRLGILKAVSADQSIEAVHNEIKEKLELPHPPRHLNTATIMSEIQKEAAR